MGRPARNRVLVMIMASGCVRCSVMVVVMSMGRQSPLQAAARALAVAGHRKGLHRQPCQRQEDRKDVMQRHRNPFPHSL